MKLKPNVQISVAPQQMWINKLTNIIEMIEANRKMLNNAKSTIRMELISCEYRLHYERELKNRLYIQERLTAYYAKEVAKGSKYVFDMFEN